MRTNTYTVYFKNGNEREMNGVYHAVNTVKKYAENICAVKYERPAKQWGYRVIRPAGITKVTPDRVDEVVEFLLTAEFGRRA